MVILNSKEIEARFDITQQTEIYFDKKEKSY
jgi:hypothetical protein